jgi:hypothetical protein
MEFNVARTFNTLYITLDLAWLALYVLILWDLRRRLAVVVGLLAGLLYFLVDYGIFYLALGTRTVTGADPFWLLLWLSMGVGFTNFAWIWLLLDRDSHAVEWSLLTIGRWLTVALLSQGLGTGFPEVAIQRGTGSYHGAMALILLVGYGILIVRNVRAGDRSGQKAKLLPLLAIGIGVQFSWEAVLLSGIRPVGLLSLVVNSLIETNLGMPYVFLIHRAVSARCRPDLRRALGEAGADKRPAAEIG